MDEGTKDKLAEAGGCALFGLMEGGCCLVQCVVLGVMAAIGLLILNLACG